MKRLAKASVSLVTVLITLLLAELSFRTLLFSHSMPRLRNPELYAESNDDDDYWKLYYMFGTGVDAAPDRPHPLLGWVSSLKRFDRESFEHAELPRLGSRRPVLLYGDSFAECATAEEECFQGVLNEDPTFIECCYLLNYGVGGYGFDQIYLLYKNSIKLYRKPFVIISLFLEDLDRSILTIRIGQKPYFNIVGDQLVLSGVPIAPNLDTFIAAHPLRVRSYLYRRLIHTEGPPWRLKSYLRGDAVKEQRKRAINGKIISELVADLRGRGLEFLFLIFHGPKAVMLDNDWRDPFLTDAFREAGVAWLSSKEIVREDARLHNKRVADYFLPDRHPNAYQNRVIADRMKRYVLEHTDY